MLTSSVAKLDWIEIQKGLTPQNRRKRSGVGRRLSESYRKVKQTLDDVGASAPLVLP